MAEVPTTFTGGCVCGAIRFECRSAPVSMVTCHCRRCQRATGGASSAGVLVHASALVVAGLPQTYTSSDADGRWVSRAFCAACGSPLWSQDETSELLLAIQAGSLDDPSWFAPRIDLWTSEAQPWALLDPALPKHPEQPR